MIDQPTNDPHSQYCRLLAAGRDAISMWDDDELSLLSDLILSVSEPSIYLGSTKAMTGNDYQSAAAQFGGYPMMPDDMSWPKVGNLNIPFLAQLHLSNLPPLPSHRLPQHGRLYFFCWCTNERSDNPCTVVWHPDDETTVSKREIDPSNIHPDWQGQRVYEEVFANEATCTLSLSPGALEVATLQSGLIEPTKLDGHYFGDFPGEFTEEILRSLNPNGSNNATSAKCLGYVWEDFLLNLRAVPGGYSDGDKRWITLLELSSQNNMLWSDDGCLAFLITEDELKKRHFGNVQPHVLSS